MMQNTSSKQSNRESFVLRIWHENDQSNWQGWVQHVRTGETILVRQIDDLLDFIELWTGKLDRRSDKGLK